MFDTAPVANSTFAAAAGGAASILAMDLTTWGLSLWLHAPQVIPTTDASAFTLLVTLVLAHFVPDGPKVTLPKAATAPQGVQNQ